MVEMGYLQAKTSCGEGDVVKTNNLLTIVKIQLVFGCVSENLFSLGKDWMYPKVGVNQYKN